MMPTWTRFLQTGLWFRVALAVTLGFLALFAAFAILGEQAIQDSTARVLDERLVIAQLAANEIDRYLEQAIVQLEELPASTHLNPANANFPTEAHTLASPYVEVGLFSGGVIFLDPAGQVVITEPPGLYATGTNLFVLPHVAQTIQEEAANISDPFYHPQTQQPVTAVTVPFWQDGRFAGITIGLLPIPNIYLTEPLDQAMILGETAHAVLVDMEGRAIVSTFDLPFLSSGEHPTFYRRAMSLHEPIIETVPFELDLPNEPEGHLHIMGFAPLTNAPWGVSVGGDVISETFAGVQRLRNGLILLGLTALGTTLLATLIGTRRLVRPVQQLTVSARQIADGDLEKPLIVNEGGEIGAMARALDHMRQQLLTNIKELARWNEELEARVEQQTEALRQQQEWTQQVLRQTIKAQEDERARLSWELHDEIGQVLTAVELSLERLQNALPAQDTPVHERLERSRALTERAVTDLRRMISALRPSILDDLGLIPALNWMSDHTLRSLGIHVNIDSQIQIERLPGEIETTLFRIAQEAMNNVARHSKAHTLAIQLHYENEQLMMKLSDDGQGFEPTRLPSRLDTGRGLGLASMQERASLVGGQIIVESRLNQGTTVTVRVPIPAATISRSN
ncbi:MAG: HAMP domain-containing protein [Ardenticatenaceae bacterium]|nr:HAMP domain-containing protein [Ardenticatenaceae bacterium]